MQSIKPQMVVYYLQAVTLRLKAVLRIWDFYSYEKVILKTKTLG